VADDGSGLEVGRHLDRLLYPPPGSIPDPGIDGPGTQVHEGGVKGDPQARLPERGGHSPVIIFPKYIKGLKVKTQFGIEAVLQDLGQILPIKEMKGQMGLHLSGHGQFGN